MVTSQLNDEIINELKKLGATHYSNAYNYNNPYSNASSIHFFLSNEKDQNNSFPECAYFIPDMHSESLGKLSGFNVCHRPNCIDLDIRPLNLN